MKPIFTILAFFILIKISAQSQYKHSGNIVFKIDSLSQVQWAKDFSGNVMPQNPSPNVVEGVVFDGRFVYVWVMQDNATGTGGVYYSTMFVLDTNGVLLSQSCEHVQPGNSFSAVQLWPAFKGGAWQATDYSPGFTHHQYLKKVDSTGNFNSSAWLIDVFCATYNNIHALVRMADSTYLAVGDCYSTTGPIPLTITCTKFRENGHLIWQKKFGGLNMNENYYITGVVTDSLNNIYLAGTYSNYPSQDATFAFKLDQAGQILHSHLFTDLSISFYTFSNNLSFHDTLLTLLYNSSTIEFDTAFNTACFNQLPSFQTYSSSCSSYNGPIGNPTYVTSNYQPNTSSYNYTFNPGIYPIYCLNLNDNDIIDNSLNFWPNPFENQITIRSSSALHRISIYDLLGRTVKQTTINSGIFETTIDFDFHDASVYVMKVDFTDGKRVIKKIIRN